MAGGGPLPVREYASVAEMRQHAADVRARLFSVQPLQAPALKAWSEPKIEEQGFFAPHAAHSRGSKKAVSHPMVRLLSRVARGTGVTVTDLRSHRRQSDVVKARHILFYVARMLTPYSYPEIGRRTGGKDHTSVMHGVSRVQAVVDRLNIKLPKSRVGMAKALWAADWSEASK